MDEFAQTREPDNLFDEDFTPIPPRAKQSNKISSHQTRHENASHPLTPQAPKTNAERSSATGASTTVRVPTAVRGDRSATGGINKPKLTESELSARLAAAKLNSARREEAYRVAEADEASFNLREAQATQKRKEERFAKRAMDDEREKNRLRKLRAQGGREWDEGKPEQDANSLKGSRYRRGAHGSVAYRGGRQQDEAVSMGYDRQEEMTRTSSFRGDRSRGDRSRRERGRGGRGGRARGGYERSREPSYPPTDHSTAPEMSAEAEFPSLPPAPLPQTEQTPPQIQQGISSSSDQAKSKNIHVSGSQEGVESFSPAGAVQSWSDEMEAKQPAGQW